MKHYEYLELMMNLERAINALTTALDNELYENGPGVQDIDKWMAAYNAQSLAKGMTATKCAISVMHKIAYGDE